jgi:hypothetical protein
LRFPDFNLGNAANVRNPPSVSMTSRWAGITMTGRKGLRPVDCECGI